MTWPSHLRMLMVNLVSAKYQQKTEIGAQPMSAERNEAIVRTWLEEAWNKGNVDEQAHIFSPSYTWLTLPAPYGTGAKGLLNFVRGFRAAFPDAHWNLEEVVASGDKVAWRVTTSGTHTGEFMGMPATGKSFNVGAIIISRFEDGLWR